MTSCRANCALSPRSFKKSGISASGDGSIRAIGRRRSFFVLHLHHVPLPACVDRSKRKNSSDFRSTSRIATQNVCPFAFDRRRSRSCRKPGITDIVSFFTARCLDSVGWCVPSRDHRCCAPPIGPASVVAEDHSNGEAMTPRSRQHRDVALARCKTLDHIIDEIILGCLLSSLDRVLFDPGDFLV